MSNSLALFDLDYTLLTCDSDVEWSRYLFNKGYINKEAELLREKYSADYHQGILDLDEFLKFQLGFLVKFPKEKLVQMHREFMQDYIYPHITLEARKLVKNHIDQGDDVVLVSATNEFIITPIAFDFNIYHVIGILLEKDKNGNFTGNYQGVPSYREGKVIRVEQWLNQQNKMWQDYQDSYFYSDSFNDLPLLQKVSRPIVVNPDNRLLSHALAQNWPIISFKEVVNHK